MRARANWTNIAIVVFLPLVAVVAIADSGCVDGARPATPATLRRVAENELRTPNDFIAITDREERSRALFMEATRAMFHPRCRNCHPDGNTPIQGDDGRVHDPPVFRGPDNHGVAALECTACHQDHNLELARVPGAPKWALAPIEMAWANKTPHQVCEQIKDPKRNGNKDLAQIVAHVAHDPLVAWAWAPGHGRVPAPGNQEQLGALVAAWVESGAACPREESKQ